METIDEKLVPPLSIDLEVIDPQTQDSFCENSLCGKVAIDCENCLFDSKRCPVEIFDKWLNCKKNGK